MSWGKHLFYLPVYLLVIGMFVGVGALLYKTIALAFAISFWYGIGEIAIIIFCIWMGLIIILNLGD